MKIEIGAKLDEEPLQYQGKKEPHHKAHTTELKPKKEHQLVFRFERRKGKPVTLVGRFCLGETEKKAVLKTLKKTLACGGSIEEEWLALQGDVKEKVKSTLETQGWKFRP